MLHAVEAPTGQPGTSLRDEQELQLLLPQDDVAEPEVTILIPAVNEELTVGDFVAWCHAGLREAGVVGEILIVDSSTDRTAEIALAGGARVLRAPKRGLGRAYIDAIPFVRGRYVIMGDADCTYDFRQLAPFVEAMRAGSEFAMGSRWRGSIEAGAMPPLHQYFGTPVTTWILNRLFSSKFTDIHCGMRGITREALIRMGLVSQSWEYASEMVLKSVRMELRTTEVPVTFLKDREGRMSHHKRSGWFSPFHAAWINLRAMFVHGAEFFLFKPGIVLLALGLVLTLPLTFGPIQIGDVTLSIFWMLIGVTLSVVGLQSIYFGCLAHVFLDYAGRRRERWQRLFQYSKTVIGSGVLFLVGFLLDLVLAIYYVTHSFTLPDAQSAINHAAITGLLFMIVGFSTFCFTLLLHATQVRYGAPDDKS
ncbi:glycosyltransferase family 2 protein [Dactylosporangium siamense]|uniref:Dolichol-P-glucose synthetase n=1 Tax=Dactylosporangium siamense TaxID=685454 RepID=A0A919PU27_9ACTN|nr:glycosyltransferase family 2 protein [Dactylosporangium siamense]GIG48533.1 dolichol-P-glucose synthetase [Dactylosporangium siamense]